MPIWRCVPIVPPARMAAFWGSTAQISMSGFCAFSTSPMPLSVPPVPMPLQKPWIGRAACSMISSAVWWRCTMGFAGFENCCGTYTRGSDFRISSALRTHSAMASPMLPASCTSTTSAP